jgi:hypothetical protein
MLPFLLIWACREENGEFSAPHRPTHSNRVNGSQGCLGRNVDDLVRVQLDAKASLRELDLLRHDLRDKADRGDVTHLAGIISNEHMSAMDRYRTVQASIGDVERALKALSDLVAQQSGVPAAARNGALSRFPPQMLLAGGVALGALAVKSPDLIGWMVGL